MIYMLIDKDVLLNRKLPRKDDKGFKKKIFESFELVKIYLNSLFVRTPWILISFVGYKLFVLTEFLRI